MNYFITYDTLVSFKSWCRAPTEWCKSHQTEEQYNNVFVHTKWACVGVMNEQITTITCKNGHFHNDINTATVEAD